MARLGLKSQQELLDLASSPDLFFEVAPALPGEKEEYLTVTIIQMSKYFYHTIKLLDCNRDRERRTSFARSSA